MTKRNLPLTVLACAFGAAMSFSAFRGIRQARQARQAKAEAPAARSEIALAHQLSSVGEENLRKLVERFNAGQPTVAIQLVRLAEGEKPAVLNLVRRQDVLEAVAGKAAFKPLHEVMKEAKKPSSRGGDFARSSRAGTTDERSFLCLAGGLLDPSSVLQPQCLPGRWAGPRTPAETWMEVQQAADKLQDAGESAPTRHPLADVDSHRQRQRLVRCSGGQRQRELAFNGLPQVKHVAMLATWHKSNFSRISAPQRSGQTFSQGRMRHDHHRFLGPYAFPRSSGVELGVAPLPHHDDVWGRQHTFGRRGFPVIGAGYKAPE